MVRFLRVGSSDRISPISSLLSAVPLLRASHVFRLFASLGIFPAEIDARLGSHRDSRCSFVSLPSVWHRIGRCARRGEPVSSAVCGPEALVLFGGTGPYGLYVAVARTGTSRLRGELETRDIGRAIFRAINSIFN